MMKKRMTTKDTGASNGNTKPPKESPAPDSRPAERPAAAVSDTNDKAVDDDRPGEAPSTPSIAQQSKLRSTSFRAGSMSGAGPASPGPFSPDGDTAPDIYRKQVARIDELERDNRKLSKESSDLEKRWQKAESEIAALRDREAKGDSAELEELVRLPMPYFTPS